MTARHKIIFHALNPLFIIIFFLCVADGGWQITDSSCWPPGVWSSLQLRAHRPPTGARPLPFARAIVPRRHLRDHAVLSRAVPTSLPLRLLWLSAAQRALSLFFPGGVRGWPRFMASIVDMRLCLALCPSRVHGLGRLWGGIAHGGPNGSRRTRAPPFTLPRHFRSPNAGPFVQSSGRAGQGRFVRAPRQGSFQGGGGVCPPSPCVTFRLVVVSLRGPGQSPILPFACCVGLLRSVGCCGRCSCWRRFHVRGAQWLVCRLC